MYPYYDFNQYLNISKINKMNYKNQQIFRAKRIIVHPYYDFDQDRNDIALVQLDGHLTDITNVRPICLPSKQLPSDLITQQQFIINSIHPYPGEVCVATGWGSNQREFLDTFFVFLFLFFFMLF